LIQRLGRKEENQQSHGASKAFGITRDSDHRTVVHKHRADNLPTQRIPFDHQMIPSAPQFGLSAPQVWIIEKPRNANG